MDFTAAYDIVVAGGGIAGIAAALQAARAGCHTALVEKTVLLGGLATTGLINVYLPLCDGQGHQVTYGLAEELLHLSYRYGPGDVPPYWRGDGDADPSERLRVRFAPNAFILALDEVLEEAGVDVWFDTLLTDAALAGDRLAGCVVENKSGRGLIQAGCFVDATGDADLAHRAGAPTAEQGNWLSMWAFQASLERAKLVAADPDHHSLLERLTLGSGSWGNGQPEGMPKLFGTDGQQVSQFVRESRRLVREHYQETHRVHDRHHTFPVTLPAMAQFRTTRRIVGQEALTSGQDGQRQPTSIGLIADWRKPGFVWEIPYGTLLPTGITGLVVAGRCISSRDDAWEVTRVIPPAALTGQVAGLAASLAVQSKTTPDQLGIDAIQAALRHLDIPLHIDQVL